MAIAGDVAGVAKIDSTQRAQNSAQRIRIGVEQALDLRVSAFPQRCGRDEAGVTGRRECQSPASLVRRIDRYLDQTAALERLQVGGKRGAIDREQCRYVRDAC